MAKDKPTDASAFSLRSDSLALSISSAVLFLTLLGLGCSFWGGPLLWLIGQFLVALAILHWFVILHDLGHGGFFRTKILNDIAGHLASFFVILPFYPWRYVHAGHHRWVGWKDLDPTMSQIQPRELSPLLRWLVNFCWRYWIPVFALSFSFGNFWNLSKLFRLARDRREIGRAHV